MKLLASDRCAIALVLYIVLCPLCASFVPSRSFSWSNPQHRLCWKNKNDLLVKGSALNSDQISDILKDEFDIDLLKSGKHLELGLAEEEVEGLLSIYGPNVLPNTPRKKWWELWVDQFDDRLVQILLFVALVSSLSSISEAMNAVELGNYDGLWQEIIEPFIILLILVINAFVGVWQQLSATESLDALKKLQPQLSTVLRNRNGRGEWVAKHGAASLVPGDVIKMKVGDRVPADVCIASISSSDFRVDESMLTGETISVGKEAIGINISNQKAGKTFMAFSGTTITKGSATAIVARTGILTEIGKIQSSIISAEEIETPLEIKLNQFADELTNLIAFICVATWIISFPRFSDFETYLEGSLYYAKIGVALGVAAIPEGLPAVISLVLALGTRRLAECNVIVKNLSSVETLGCTTIICTDKTGTLTTNQMTAVSLVTVQQNNHGYELFEHSVSGTSYQPTGEVDGIRRGEAESDGCIASIIAVCVGCNDARLYESEEDRFSIIGEPMEAALLTLAEKLGCAEAPTASGTRKAWERQWERYCTRDFDRRSKSMSTLCRSRNRDSTTHQLLVKGAPDLLLQKCSYIQLRNGEIISITPKLRHMFKSDITSLSSRPLRCLLLAMKFIDNEDSKGSPSFDMQMEKDLILVGLIGITDPPRKDATRSIALCKDAGIRVAMITGDNYSTAVAIAKELKILPQEASCLDCNEQAEFLDQSGCQAFDGEEFFSKPESEQIVLLSKGNLVFSRTDPSDKKKIVKMLQSLGEVTAMTGDGVNDAPALRQASIGIAMGSGTDVAKEASDMILADDSFSTIVRGVKEGRCIYANMQAFINFLISCNIGEVLAVFFATILGYPPILSAMQLLWINLITDGPPATALGWNPTDEAVMNEPPRNQNENIITPWFAARYLVIGSYVGLATLGVFATHYDPTFPSITNFVSSHTNALESIPINTFEEANTIQSTLMTAQTMGLTTCITTELLQALSSVSVDSSLLTIGPQDNPVLVIGVLVPFAIHLSILNTPYLCECFGLVPLDWSQWTEIFVWSAPILLVDEALKYFARKRKESDTVSRIGGK